MTVRTGCTEREVENNYVNRSNLAGEPVAFAKTNKQGKKKTYFFKKNLIRRPKVFM